MFIADLIMSVQSHLLKQYSHDVKIFKHHMSDVLYIEKSSCERTANKHHQIIATVSYIFDCDMKAVRDHCIYLK